MIKYCLSSKEPQKFLEQADEIFVSYKDREQIIDLVDTYPSKTIILEVPKRKNIVIDTFINYNTIAKGKIIFMLHDFNMVNSFKINKLKYFFSYIACTFADLESLKLMGACYAYVGAPAFFNFLDTYKFGMEIRVMPHIANDTKMPVENGICGTWTRPEDERFYDPCTFDFYMEDLEREQALLDIYKNKSWNNYLNLIVNDLNYSCLNNLILQDFTVKRLTCGQMCKQTGRCKLCYTALKLANKDLVQNYKEEKINVES